jgi:hypothetical protein
MTNQNLPVRLYAGDEGVVAEVSDTLLFRALRPATFGRRGATAVVVDNRRLGLDWWRSVGRRRHICRCYRGAGGSPPIRRLGWWQGRRRSRRTACAWAVEWWIFQHPPKKNHGIFPNRDSPAGKMGIPVFDRKAASGGVDKRDGLLTALTGDTGRAALRNSRGGERLDDVGARAGRVGRRPLCGDGRRWGRAHAVRVCARSGRNRRGWRGDHGRGRGRPRAGSGLLVRVLVRRGRRARGVHGHQYQSVSSSVVWCVSVCSRTARTDIGRSCRGERLEDTGTTQRGLHMLS